MKQIERLIICSAQYRPIVQSDRSLCNFKPEKQMLIFTQFHLVGHYFRECLYSVPLTCVAGVYRAIRILSLWCIQCRRRHSLAQHVDCYDVTLFRQYTGKNSNHSDKQHSVQMANFSFFKQSNIKNS